MNRPETKEHRDINLALFGLLAFFFTYLIALGAWVVSGLIILSEKGVQP